jgi:hypothetical protein
LLPFPFSSRIVVSPFTALAAARAFGHDWSLADSYFVRIGVCLDHQWTLVPLPGRRWSRFVRSVLRMECSGCHIFVVIVRIVFISVTQAVAPIMSWRWSMVVRSRGWFDKMPYTMHDRPPPIRKSLPRTPVMSWLPSRNPGPTSRVAEHRIAEVARSHTLIARQLTCRSIAQWQTPPPRLHILSQSLRHLIIPIEHLLVRLVWKGICWQHFGELLPSVWIHNVELRDCMLQERYVLVWF